MCMIDDADPSDFTSERWHRAKKPHACADCRRTIEPGERYRYCALRYKGQIEAHHTCLGCTAAEDWLRRECGGWLFGAVEEDLADHLEHGPWSADEERQPIRPSRPARLVVAMRRKWRRFDGDGLMVMAG